LRAIHTFLFHLIEIEKNYTTLSNY